MHKRYFDQLPCLQAPKSRLKCTTDEYNKTGSKKNLAKKLQ